MVGVGAFSRPDSRESSLGYMSPQEQESFLSSLSRNAGTALEQLGLLLDTPGAIARGVLAGDPMSGFNWDYDKRTSGEELLRSYGVLGKDTNPYASTAAGLAADILTDPLTWSTFGLGALSKAGKAAKAANILDLAPMAAQRKMGSAAANTLTGSVTNAALDKMLPQGLARTAENYAVRPLVGPRLARTMTNLDDVVQAAPDPVKALEKVTQYLDSKGLSYDAVRGQNLGGAIGLGPFSPLVTFTPPGARPVLDAMDALGQKIGWSYPARVASAAFDERVGGMIDAGDQVASLRQFQSLDAARSAGRRAALEHAELVSKIPMSDRAKQLLGDDSLFSARGNDFLTRLFEGKPTATDRALMRELPGIDRAVQSWDRLRTQNVAEAQRLGLDFTQLRDPRFGVEYSPRSGTELDFGEYGTGFGRSMYQSRVLEEMHRNPALFTPGGTVDLREASRLPSVREFATKKGGSQLSVAQVGTDIANYINGKHGYQAIDQNQGEAIARVMFRMNKDLPNDTPIFAGFPLNEQTRVIINQEVARANANHIYDSMAEAAIGAQANQIAGSGFKPITAAMNDIASKAGIKGGGSGSLDPAVQRQLQDRIASRLGLNPQQVDLSQFAIPEQLYNRLNRVQDFYSSPRVQQEVGGMLDKLTQFWKSSILAFPSRHVRDAYSNAIAVWMETGDPIATTYGFGLAKKVLDGNIDAVLPQIAKLPQYRRLGTPSAIKTQFLGDVAASGILTGLSQSDVLSARRAGDLSRIMPGLNPVSRMRAFGEFIPDGSRSLPQMLTDQLAIKGLTNQFETRNAVLNWSQKLSDANDSIARLGGYLALLSKGVSPEQAVQRMHNALVNYESLTTFERGFMRKIFPWWAYTSRAGKYVVQNLIDSPGGSVAQVVRGTNVLTRPDGDTYVPQRLRQQVSVRIPNEILEALGIPQAADTQSFLRIDMPGMRDIQTINPFSLQDTVGNLAMQTNPFLQSLASLAFDTDLYSKRRLSDSDPPVNKLYRAATGENLSPLAKIALSNIPGTQRLLSLGGTLVDDRNSTAVNTGKAMFNALSGMGYTQVGPDWRDADAKQQALQRMGPLAKSFGIQYVDKEGLQNATPEEQRLALIFEILNQRQRESAKAKKNAPLAVPAMPTELSP